jgi:hypothetical protein
MSAGANEVWAGRSPAVLGVIDEQAVATAAAVEGTLEVVGMPTLQYASQVVAGEHMLHLVPGLGRKQPRMPSLIKNPRYLPMPTY